MRYIILAALSPFILSPASAAEPLSYAEHMAKAAEAFQNEDWPVLNTHLDAANAHRPYSLYLWKNRILARLLDGKTDQARGLASIIAERGLYLNLSGHPTFDLLSADPDYAPIAAQFEGNLASIGDAAVIAEYDDTDLLPEGYEADGKNRYFGSVRTGEIYTLDGATPMKAEGGVFDLEVRGGKVWAVVNNQLAFEEKDAAPAFAAFTVFNRKSGDIIQEARLNGEDTLLGDLEVTKQGLAIASDSKTPRLYRFTLNGGTPEVFVEDPRFVNLQGIALDEKNGRIYVADYLAGLFVVELCSRRVTSIRNDANAHLGGIDGLYYDNNTLIGVQNGVTPHRIVKIELDKEGLRASSLTVLAQNLTGWNEPTHGDIVGKKFEYIAASNWPAYNEGGDINLDTERKPVSIMSVPIK